MCNPIEDYGNKRCPGACPDWKIDECSKEHSHARIVNGCYYNGDPDDESYEEKLNRLESIDESGFDSILYLPLLEVLSENVE
jgi:hypothetical protein